MILLRPLDCFCFCVEVKQCLGLCVLKVLALISMASGFAATPNIVFCMADDWSYPHASALGDTTVQTPHFDRVAREGILFPNAFVSTPSCTPSRLSILAGQHHWRLKEGASLGGSLREEFPVYTDMLQSAGYLVGRFGKGVWPSKHTFRNRDSFGPRYKSFEAFLDKRQSGQPFCYWHGGRDPHRPYQTGMGVKSGIELDRIKVPGCLPDHPVVRSDLADYYWHIQCFDKEVGRIFEHLEALGELDHTIFVVSGDNGMPFPRGKATLYDLGTRVPLAIRWGDKLKIRGTSDTFVSLCDLAPTFLGVSELAIPIQMTGKSLLPLLMGEASVHRDFVLTGNERHCFLNPSRALRTKDFLLIRNFDSDQWPTGDLKGKQPRYDFVKTPWPTGPGAFCYNIDPSPSKQLLRLHRATYAQFVEKSFGTRPAWELYDLKNDPDQLRNVASEDRLAGTLRQLQSRLHECLVIGRDPRIVATERAPRE